MLRKSATGALLGFAGAAEGGGVEDGARSAEHANNHAEVKQTVAIEG